MISVKISPRLKAMADRIPVGSVVADIGTDHALLPIYLVGNEISDEIYASDINDGVLDRAAAGIKKRLGKEGKKITLLTGSGFDNIPEHCDTVVIAGMGGDLIADILAEGYGNRNARLILQPMTAQDRLRKYLYDNGFCIVDEIIVKEMEHRYYSIIIAERGEESYSELDVYVSKPLRKRTDEITLNFIEKVYRTQRAKISGMKISRVTRDEDIRRETVIFKELEKYLEDRDRL